MKSNWSQCAGAFRSTVNSTRNGEKCRNVIGLCLTVLTEDFGMQLVSAKFVHGFWLKKKRRIDWPFATTWSRWELNALNYYIWWGVGLLVWYQYKTAIFVTEVRIIPNKEKKCKKSRSSLKTVLIILFNYWGMVHYECIPRGQKVTQE